MAGSTSSGGGPIVGINVTPMVDVVLVLLVIMMVSATYIVQQSLKVELPKTATSDEAASSPAAVTITKDGAFFFGGSPVERARARGAPPFGGAGERRREPGRHRRRARLPRERRARHRPR